MKGYKYSGGRNQNSSMQDSGISNITHQVGLDSQATEIIELARPDSSNVEWTSKSKDFDAPGIAWVRRNGRVPSSFSSEEQNDHSSCSK